MLRLPLSDIDEALKNPGAYREKIRTSTESSPRKYSYFNALRNAIFKFHNDNEGIARSYLLSELGKFKNSWKCAETVDNFNWYLLDYAQRGWEASLVRQRVQVLLPPWIPPHFVCTGEVSRVDIIPSGGYAAWLFRSRDPDDWQHETRMPLIQDSIATILGAPIEEVLIGIYSFKERIVETHSYKPQEISLAHEVLDKLLQQIALP